MLFQQACGQRHKLVLVGDGKYFQERRDRADLSAALEFQGGRCALAPDLAAFVDDQRRLSLELAIAQGIVGVGVGVERIIIHGLAGRAQSTDRKWRQNSQLLDRQRSVAFVPAVAREDFVDPDQGLVVDTHQGAQIDIASRADDLAVHGAIVFRLREAKYIEAYLARGEDQVAIQSPNIGITPAADRANTASRTGDRRGRRGCRGNCTNRPAMAFRLYISPNARCITIPRKKQTVQRLRARQPENCGRDGSRNGALLIEQRRNDGRQPRRSGGRCRPSMGSFGLRSGKSSHGSWDCAEPRGPACQLEVVELLHHGWTKRSMGRFSVIVVPQCGSFPCAASARKALTACARVAARSTCT